MPRTSNKKLSSITNEVDHLHPILDSLLRKLPYVRELEYHHGPNEKGADFVLSRANETFDTVDYIGVIAKVGRIHQDFTDVERQIDECSLDRFVESGKKKIQLTEIWVIVTGHITQNAKEKISQKYSNRKIEFIDGRKLETLVDKYVPLAWSHLPIVVGEYLQDLRVRTEEQDKSVSLLQTSDETFYVKQDLFHLPDIEYRYKPKHYRPPQKVEVHEITESHRCILIEGGVGSGKSKLLRRLVFDAVVPEVFRGNKIIPLLATFAELKDKHSGQLSTLIDDRVSMEIKKSCPDSEYLVLIDAFDEWPMDIDNQAGELDALFKQASNKSRIRVVVTSRFLNGVSQSSVLPSNVARFELRPLSMRGTLEFIIKMCRKINVKDRILEDLKKSHLFRNMPRSPMSAILLARLLNENQQDIPSNMTELYAKYSELILGRWDEEKGLQSQKEYQALDNILMRLARQMIDSGRLLVPIGEVKDVFRKYLGRRNLEIDADELFDKMVNRCEIMFIDSNSDMLGFKHRSFTEFFYAKSFVANKSLNVDHRVFRIYWLNIFFFYLGLIRDCPEDLRKIFEVKTESEIEQWMKIISVSDYLLAAYTTPYEVIEEGIFEISTTVAQLYQKIIKEGSDIWLSDVSQMTLLSLLQVLARQGYSYSFFIDAIETAALRISESSLDEETRAYALFFLNVAYVDVDGGSFDLMLKLTEGPLPVNLQLALSHEGKKEEIKVTKLMQKQEKHLRRIIPKGDARKMFYRKLYERPLNEVAQQALKAQERREEKERKDRGRD